MSDENVWETGGGGREHVCVYMGQRLVTEVAL